MKTYREFLELITEKVNPKKVSKAARIDDRSAKSLADRFNKKAILIANMMKADMSPSDLENATENGITNLSSEMSKYNNTIFQMVNDWVIAGINNDLNKYKGTPFSQITSRAKQWHDDLEASGQLNFKETGNVLLDYREDGIGYYWVDIGKSYCPLEKQRMAHCASTSRGDTLLSFRSINKVSENTTMGNSHLTAAYNSSEKIIHQLKGKNNSKPSPDYIQYIHDLLLKTDLVDKFGFEYESKSDFHLTDMSNEQIQSLFDKKPDIFLKSKYGKEALEQAGVNTDDLEFETSLESGYISLGGDFHEFLWYYCDMGFIPYGNKYSSNEEVAGLVTGGGRNFDYDAHEHEFYSDIGMGLTSSDLPTVAKHLASDMVETVKERTGQDISEDHMVELIIGTKEIDDYTVSGYINRVLDDVEIYTITTQLDNIESQGPRHLKDIIEVQVDGEVHVGNYINVEISVDVPQDEIEEEGDTDVFWREVGGFTISDIDQLGAQVHVDHILITLNNSSGFYDTLHGENSDWDMT